MERYEIRFAARVAKDLRGVPKPTVQRILRSIDKLALEPYPAGAKKLSGNDYWRLRQGDYRILYRVIDEVLVIDIIKIGHRRDVYRG